MRQFRLAAHPRGRGVEDSDFTLVELERPAPGDGQVLLKLRWLGFDPAQKGWMENFADYAAPMAIGDVMRGSGIGEVVETRTEALRVGDLVPPTAMLSVLGTTGFTAWHGLFEVGRPIPGDTVLISGAAGATGSIVGQLAKIGGCRVVGIAGGADKCGWLVQQAGFDAAVDYRAEDFRQLLRATVPEGANVVFDNVGGAVLDAMLGVIATGARVVICGAISRYQNAGRPAGPSNYFNVVLRRARMEGFIIVDHAERFAGIRRRLTDLATAGRLVWRIDEQEGFENAPATLRRLFTGDNRGKQVLRI